MQIFISWPVLIVTAFLGVQPPCQLREGCSLFRLDGNQEPVTISENDVTDGLTHRHTCDHLHLWPVPARGSWNPSKSLIPS